MDAVPLTLGEEFSAFACQVKNGIAKLKEAIQPFHALPMGGTAVGNGLNAPPAFGPRVVALLGEKLNEPLVPSRNRFETQASRDDIVSLTGVLDTIGASLFKLLNDLRLMNSGPHGGLNELLLPALQPGSSCMPAKVNPVLCDSLLQILCFVHGGNESVRQCALLSGHFQLNTSSTHLVYTLFESIRLLANGTERFTTYYLGELEPNLSQLEGYLRGSHWEASRLVPILGYDVATALAQRAERREKSLVDMVKEEKIQNPFSVQWQRALEVLLEK
jgi:fumarate hydratase class II